MDEDAVGVWAVELVFLGGCPDVGGVGLGALEDFGAGDFG